MGCLRAARLCKYGAFTSDCFRQGQALTEEAVIGTQEISLEILGTGECIPSRRVHSKALDLQLGKQPGWVLEHTGVESRAFADADEDVVSMGAMAARQALHNADVEARELDAIIAVGSVPAQPIPCTAAFLQRALGLSASGIAAFDVNATCLGLLAALDLVAQSIATGRYRRVLIVASERLSMGIDWKDAATAGLFGDGAGAVVVGPLVARAPHSWRRTFRRSATAWSSARFAPADRTSTRDCVPRSSWQERYSRCAADTSTVWPPSDYLRS